MTSQDKHTHTEPPAPEMLKPQADEAEAAAWAASSAKASSEKSHMRARRLTYRPSHKATFIGSAVVVVILLINVGVFSFLMYGKGSVSAEQAKGDVVLSTQALEKIGVSHSTIGSSGAELVVSPAAKFNNGATVNGDLSVAGQLKLNGAFSAGDGNFTQLKAGNTQIEKLTVNADSTMNSLTLQRDLSVAGLTKLNGPVTINQLLTVAGSVNVAGNLAIGGTLTTRNFSASSLTSDTTLTIGGHIVTRGNAPGVSGGPALGSNGTVSISGTDAAGTVAANFGVGAGGGVVANVGFRQSYTNTPHVVVTVVGRGLDGVYINRSGSGFSIGVNGAAPAGGYAFDYIVVQ